MGAVKRKLGARCCLCGRPLENPESIRQGIGPECRKTVANGIGAAGYGVGALAILIESPNANAQRWARLAMQATHVRPKEVGRFMDAALRFHGPIREDQEAVDLAGLRLFADPDCDQCEGQGTVGAVPEFSGDDCFGACECTEGK